MNDRRKDQPGKLTRYVTWVENQVTPLRLIIAFVLFGGFMAWVLPLASDYVRAVAPEGVHAGHPVVLYP